MSEADQVTDWLQPERQEFDVQNGQISRQRRHGQTQLAATNKCLAQSNKSSERGTATKERRRQRHPGCGSIQPMAQNLSAGQRDVMKLIVRALSNEEMASVLNLAKGTVKILTAKECLQSAEACLATRHKSCRA